MQPPRVVAVDWSGRRGPDQAETIWVAEVVEGRLGALRNGRTRAQVIEHLRALADGGETVFIGLDFSFSLPAWWLTAQGCADVRAAWALIEARGEDLIAHMPAPFWGRAASVAAPPEARFRRTESALRAAGMPAKSTFQLAGAGAVGVGSLRGIPHLRALADHPAVSVWPFDAPGRVRVLEIYPRALTGKADKRRWASRHAILHARFAEQDPRLLERAAGSEDAFDAAVSALVMAAHLGALNALAPSTDPVARLEGWVWAPGVSLPA